MPRSRDLRHSTSEDEVQLVRFRLGAESFAVNVEQVREIVKIGQITKIPEMPPFIEGVMNLRGHITTIVDLTRRFDITDSAGRTDHSRIIVAEVGENQLGIVVDRVQDVVRVGKEIISAPPEVISGKVDTRFLTGICRMKEGLVMLLDINNLLSEEEMLNLGRMNKPEMAGKTGTVEV